MRIKIAALTLLAALTANTSVALAQTEDVQRTRPNPQLLTAGIITTGVAYTPAVLVAVTSPKPEDKYLYAPLAGPWLNLAKRSPEGDTTGNRALLVVDGVVQAMGALQIFASFLFVDRSNPATLETDAFVAHFVPSRLPNGGYGVTARGNF
jgi:hypothetical protein